MNIRFSIKFFLLPFLCLFTNNLLSQSKSKLSDCGHGIDFLQNVSWDKVVQAAKAEHRYIFVDCYASWCGPCKRMDKEVFPLDNVGAFMNDRFVSLRLQLDTTNQDTEDIRSFYVLAHEFGKQYNIHAFPTYLFFSPDGQVLHKEIGSRNAEGFLSIVEEALDSNKQFYTLVNQYRTGSLQYSLFPYVAGKAWEFGEDSIRKAICDQYMHNYLERLPVDQLWTKENVFFALFCADLLNSDAKLFQFYYRDRDKIDSIFKSPHYSDYLINLVIYAQWIKPAVNTAISTRVEPDWEKMSISIESKYNHRFAEDNILKGRVKFYKATKEWSSYSKYFVQHEQFTGIENIRSKDLNADTTNAYRLNNAAWEVFHYSKSKEDLAKALSWEERAIYIIDTAELAAKPIAYEFMDTKANLLYKLGRRNEALAIEERVVSLTPNGKEFHENLDKMRKSVPTWNF